MGLSDLRGIVGDDGVTEVAGADAEAQQGGGDFGGSILQGPRCEGLQNASISFGHRIRGVHEDPGERHG
jgi:hypothetical protein